MMPKWLKPGRPISRGHYFIAGLVLFAVKHNRDRIVALAYGRPWGVLNYWAPLQKVVHVASLSPEERSFLGALLFSAIPFVAVGVWLTLRRLQTLGLPGWLVILFFLPFLNLLFFGYLSVTPSRISSAPDSGRPGIFESFIPESAPGSAAVSLLFTVPICLGRSLLCISLVSGYRWGLFVAVPFRL